MSLQPTRKRELHICGNTWCLKTPLALLPFYRMSDDEVILLDSGIMCDSSIADYFSDQGIRVTAVLYTHGHYDHIGGDHALKAQFGTVSYLPQAENGLQIPVPPGKSLSDLAPEIRDFFSSYEFTPDVLLPDDCSLISVMGVPFEVISCPGHTRGHVAYVTPDRVCYLGDLVVSPGYLSATKFLYAEKRAEDRRSKKDFLNRQFSFCVAAHRGVFPGAQLSEVIQKNLSHADRTEQTISALLDKSANEEILFQLISHAMRLSPASAHEDYINQCCIYSYLEDMACSRSNVRNATPGQSHTASN